MADRTPQQELEILRVSVARIAQSLNLDHHIPGSAYYPGPMNYTSLAEAAKTLDRGWNALCAEIIEAINGIRDDLSNIIDRTGGADDHH